LSRCAVGFRAQAGSACRCQSRDVCRLHRQHPHLGTVHCRRWPWARARAPPGSSSPSRSGFGPRCSSRISRRRWRRAAARRRPPPAQSAHDDQREETRRAQAGRVFGTVLRRKTLRKGDVVLVEAGDLIPCDGEVIDGVASVDESAVTGESAPVIRESGGDFSSVTGGTRVLVRLDRRARDCESGRDLPGSHDRDGRRCETPQDAERDRADHPAREPDDRLPAGDGDAAALLAVCGAQSGPAMPVEHYRARGAAGLPDPDDHWRPALGHRHRGHEPDAAGERRGDLGRAIEAAGDVDTLLLDKTGTITLGNRQAAAFFAAPGVRNPTSPTPRSWRRSRTRRRKGAASWCWPSRSFNVREHDVHALGACSCPSRRRPA
jgi:K+-transporting ATPase ATPase B chain